MKNLLDLIIKELEIDKSYTIDKKTLVSLLNDLKNVKLIKLKKFNIQFEKIQFDM